MVERPVTIWPAVRAVIVFCLGVAIILDALIGRSEVVPKLVVGMVMVGVLPLDSLFWHRNGKET